MMTYQDITLNTNKKYYGLLELLEVDYDYVKAGQRTIRIFESRCSIDFHHELLRKYVQEKGYQTFDDYLIGLGWEAHSFKNESELGTKTLFYYTLGNYKLNLITSTTDLNDEDCDVYQITLMDNI